LVRNPRWTSSWQFFLSTIKQHSSETTVTDGVWMNIVKWFPAVTVCRNHHDVSSGVLTRPDTTLTLNDAVFLRVESKAREADGELISKLFIDVHKSFPQGSFDIVGVSTSLKLVRMHIITLDPHRKNFILSWSRSYRVDLIKGRIDFLVDVMKVMRWA
jgi:hypothetical protein